MFGNTSGVGNDAALFNGVIFDGEQIVLPEQLESTDSEANILDVEKFQTDLQEVLGQFTRNYTQTTKRGLLTTNKG